MTPERPACRRFLVAGKVQRIGFRYATAQKAAELGLAGHARNLDDGCVEVLACGDEAALAALERWLHLGPPLARVSRVTRAEAGSAPAPAGFRIL